MEKLQSAIDKARAQRKSGGTGPKAHSGSTSEPLVLSDPSAVDARWEALTPLTLSDQVLKKNLLATPGSKVEVGPFDLLRSRVLQQAEINNWKRIAIASPHAGCGKTTIIANLALGLGRNADLRTAVFDLDLRHPTLGKKFGATPDYTMGDVLQRRVSFAEHAVCLGGNVAIGANRTTVSSSSEILQSQTTSDVLAEIETDFAPDIMLFDLPPLQSTDDNFGFLKNVDCVLLVAEAERTTVNQIDVAERQLAELTNVMGVVLNKNRYRDNTFGYGYGY